jgi:hypothetical protein
VLPIFFSGSPTMLRNYATKKENAVQNDARNMCLTCQWVGSIGSHIPLPAYEKYLAPIRKDTDLPPTEEEIAQGYVIYMLVGDLAEPLFCPMCGKETLIGFEEAMDHVLKELDGLIDSTACGRV